jgi:hypothetical protein
VTLELRASRAVARAERTARGWLRRP